jgi:hypothetical protein
VKEGIEGVFGVLNGGSLLVLTSVDTLDKVIVALSKMIPQLTETIDLLVQLLKKGVLMTKIIVLISPALSILYFTTVLIQYMEKRY